jgi:hypothetical protein
LIFLHHNRLNDQLDIDLSPLKGWKLGHLNLSETTFKNFSTIQDLDFTGITMWDNYPEDLEKLKGKQLKSMFLARYHGTLDMETLLEFPLTSLRLGYLGVKNIELLNEMELERLFFSGVNGLTSIEFIRDMKSLKSLTITQQRMLKDLRPIFDLELNELVLDPIYFITYAAQINNMKSLQKIGTPQTSLLPKSVFWKEFKNQGESFKRKFKSNQPKSR